MWRALAGNPVRFLLSAWPWRSLAYVAGALLVPLLIIRVPLGDLERFRLRLLEPITFTGPVPRARAAGYLAGLLLIFLPLGAAAALAVASCLLLLTLPVLLAIGGTGLVRIQLGGWAVETVAQAGAVTLLAGLPATFFTLYGVSVLAGVQAEFAKWLLGAGLTGRVDELTRSRTRLVEAFEAERRRIERDLHDGAQQHLVLLTMKLGLAELELTGPGSGPDSGSGTASGFGPGSGSGTASGFGPGSGFGTAAGSSSGPGLAPGPGTGGRAAELVGEAHQQARLALAALREQIRGIHPQVLTDFGLVEAIRELAERCTVPIEIDLSLPGRLPPEVESTAYFVVGEAVTNVVRHASASRIRIGGGLTGRHLTVTVTDDGRGGADPARGSGVRGLADRVAVLDGTLRLDSPAGGPTMVRIDLPCHSG